ncbi:MAG: hypothetical protein M1572_07180 [Gammaproteobacteria bacterium]|nr:hypothetical protein [Gammaproteobacteria bacterium]
MVSLLDRLHELIPESAWKRLGLIVFNAEDVAPAKKAVNDMAADALIIIDEDVLCDDWIKLNTVSNALRIPEMKNTKVWLAKCDQVLCYLPRQDKSAIPNWVWGLCYRSSIEQVPMQCFIAGQVIAISPQQMALGQQFCQQEDAIQQTKCDDLKELSLDYDYDDSCLWQRGHVSLDQVTLPMSLIRRFHVQCEEGDRLFMPYADDTNPNYDERVENWQREMVCLADALRKILPSSIEIYVYQNGPFNYNLKTNIKDIPRFPLSLQAQIALQDEMKQAGGVARHLFSVNRKA